MHIVCYVVRYIVEPVKCPLLRICLEGTLNKLICDKMQLLCSATYSLVIRKNVLLSLYNVKLGLY